MGVNAAAFVRCYLRSDKRSFLNLLLPIAGFLICLYLWCNLPFVAKRAGLAWLATGFLYGEWKTRWFRRKIEFAVPDEEAIGASPTPQDE